MLSFIYRLVNDFESTHDLRPNLLYLNEEHLQHLKDGFSKEYDLFRIMQTLGMEIIIDRGCVHPHVAWTRIADTNSAVC
jgi:hypothetical protein